MKKINKKIKKVEKFNERLVKTLNSISKKMENSQKRSICGPKVKVNKNIIILKVSDTDEVVELINPLILSEREDSESEGKKILAIGYNTRDGKLVSAILTKEDADNFYEEYHQFLFELEKYQIRFLI